MSKKEKIEDDEVKNKIITLKKSMNNLALRPLSELLGFNNRFLEKIKESEIGFSKISENYFNSLFIDKNELLGMSTEDKEEVIVNGKEIRNRLEANEPKFEGEEKITKERLEKVKNTVKNLCTMQEDVPRSLESTKKFIDKYSDLIKEYKEIISNITTFKNINFKEIDNDKNEVTDIRLYDSVKEKLDEMTKIYSEYTTEQIINTLLFQQSKQYLGEREKKLIRIIDNNEKIDKMLEIYNEQLLEIKEKQIKSPKEELETVLMEYNIYQKDLEIILGCSPKTIGRIKDRQEIEMEKKSYYLTLKELKYDYKKMRGLLEINNNKENKNTEESKKLKHLINILKIGQSESEIQQELEDVIRIRAIQESLNLEKNYYKLSELTITMVILFLEFEKHPDRILLQNLVDEKILIINKDETNEVLKIEIYSEVEEMIKKLEYTYCEFTRDEIINSLLEKSLERYVKCRILN